MRKSNKALSNIIGYIFIVLLFVGAICTLVYLAGGLDEVKAWFTNDPLKGVEITLDSDEIIF